MSEGPSIERIAHPRAVADPSVETLAARAEELARSWVLAQLAARPLPAMAEVPLEQLAEDAPALCEQLVLALSSDVQLERLLAPATASSRESFSTERAERAIVGADASALVVSVEALRSVVWRALLAELRDPPAALVADLAERLGYVCAAVLTVALAASHEARAAAPGPGSAPAVAASPAPRVEYERSRTAARSGAVLIDELHEEARSEASTGSLARRARAHPWDTPLREERHTPSVVDAEAISARDVPGDDAAQMRVRRQSSVPVDELR
jgi:hypothetical protein